MGTFIARGCVTAKPRAGCRPLAERSHEAWVKSRTCMLCPSVRNAGNTLAFGPVLDRVYRSGLSPDPCGANTLSERATLSRQVFTSPSKAKSFKKLRGACCFFSSLGIGLVR